MLRFIISYFTLFNIESRPNIMNKGSTVAIKPSDIQYSFYTNIKGFTKITYTRIHNIIKKDFKNLK